MNAHRTGFGLGLGELAMLVAAVGYGLSTTFSVAVLDRIRTALDPSQIMNPGGLRL